MENYADTYGTDAQIQSRHRYISSLRTHYEDRFKKHATRKSNHIPNYTMLDRKLLTDLYKMDERMEWVMDKLNDHFTCEQYEMYDNLTLYNEIDQFLKDTTILPTRILNKMYEYLFSVSFKADDYITNKPFYVLDINVFQRATEPDMSYMDEIDKEITDISIQTHQKIIEIILYTYQHLYGHKSITERVNWLIENDRIDIPRLFVFCYYYFNIHLLWGYYDETPPTYIEDTLLQTELYK